HGDSPNMRSSAGKRLWDNGSNQIASLIPEVAFVSLAVTDGQSYLVRVAHPTMSAPSSLISRGTTFVVCRHSGVEAPTAAASNQCVFGNPRLTLLYLVSPPEPVSRGSPIACKRRNSSQRVALTAVAAFKGAFACARTWASRV